jgi:hypothetical protein
MIFFSYVEKVIGNNLKVYDSIGWQMLPCRQRVTSNMGIEISLC